MAGIMGSHVVEKRALQAPSNTPYHSTIDPEFDSWADLTISYLSPAFSSAAHSDIYTRLSQLNPSAPVSEQNSFALMYHKMRTGVEISPIFVETVRLLFPRGTSPPWLQHDMRMAGWHFKRIAIPTIRGPTARWTLTRVKREEAERQEAARQEAKKRKSYITETPDRAKSTTEDSDTWQPGVKRPRWAGPEDSGRGSLPLETSYPDEYVQDAQDANEDYQDAKEKEIERLRDDLTSSLNEVKATQVANTNRFQAVQDLEVLTKNRLVDEMKKVSQELEDYVTLTKANQTSQRRARAAFDAGIKRLEGSICSAVALTKASEIPTERARTLTEEGIKRLKIDLAASVNKAKTTQISTSQILGNQIKQLEADIKRLKEATDELKDTEQARSQQGTAVKNEDVQYGVPWTASISATTNQVDATNSATTTRLEDRIKDLEVDIQAWKDDMRTSLKKNKASRKKHHTGPRRSTDPHERRYRHFAGKPRELD
ncbi:hypothetical protein B0T22DRAFT_485161 [Podospora appendiculata]|uniref:Uncharacterized protein n=1 Tax=Podospora appendiculata TaxID=314037 RepID=A0AAE1C7J7_9PEZI|nr:hypothetical protein B0T22DRAFT_485161 [Podospora appendiculata]